MTFDFFLGGYGRDSYRLILNSNNLMCSEYYGIPTEHDKVIPIEGDLDWEELLAFLSTCKWKRRYDSNVLDGTQWELKVKAPDFQIKSYGSNAYPLSFDNFLDKLNQVLSKAEIKIRT